MRRKNFLCRTAILMLLVLFTAVCALPVGSVSAAADVPKYVFYFIGDGLGASQRQVAEFYMQEKKDDPTFKLTMNTFDVAGINTTHSADTLVTDSAAAGTALAAGYKTNNGMIAMLPDKTKVKTLIEAAEEKGMGTGLISTTRLTHATPAVFAAHNESRGNENEIAVEMAASGVDFIAGGGYRHFVPQNWTAGKSKREDGRDLLWEMKENGYNMFVSENDTQRFLDYTPKGEEKLIGLFTNSHMPYEVDRVNEGSEVPSLAQLTQKGIEVLSKYDDGFFVMIESGRIDHACHANDPAGTIHDTLAFDESIKAAYDFYLQHPDETLIVVVGDHETGGMGLGFGKNYFLKLEELFDVKASFADVLNYGSGKYKKGNDRDAYFTYIAENFGLDNLTEDEKNRIVKAMDIVDQEIDPGSTYGGYNPVAMAATHVISERANLYWTTYAHSATSIPMSAIGVGAGNFGGYKDNTEIAKAMAALMGFELGPIQ